MNVNDAGDRADHRQILAAQDGRIAQKREARRRRQPKRRTQRSGDANFNKEYRL